MIDYRTFTVTPFMQNCRVFFNDETMEACVVDPGDSADRIFENLKAEGFSIKTILITHMHLDHVGGVHRLAELSGAGILGSAIEDSPILNALDMQAEAFGLPRTEIFDNTWLTDGQKISPIEGIEFKVLATPGHTPGGICFYSEKKKLVLTGDSLFYGSIGRTDFPLGDTDALFSSIKEKLYTLPDETSVLPGHGPESSIYDEKRSNPYTV